MGTQKTTGYDAAQNERDHDDLDRWRFAGDIVEVIIGTPPDWPARIGVFGKWGEGKSTVLRFAEYLLKEKQCLAIRFNPWAIRDWNDLWQEFGSAVFEALSSADIPYDGSWKKSVRDAGKWLEAKGVARFTENVADYFGKGKAYSTTFGVVGRWLWVDGPQIRAIRDKLGDRRIVVLIDDLDRCAPDLLPRLLLSLRELLDLPGFTFVRLDQVSNQESWREPGGR